MPASNQVTTLHTRMWFASKVVSMAKTAIASFPAVISLAILFYGTSVFVEVVPTLLSEFVG
jgi:hypothetical protein